MTYTEIKERNGKRYYYRVRNMREGKKFRKERMYMGNELSKEELIQKEEKADKELNKDKIKKSISEIKPKILQVLKKNNVKKAGIFGSYARGEQKKDSDVDILIEPPKGIGFGFVRIAIELEDKLKKRVDLISYNGINHLLRNKILSQEIRII